MELKWCSRTRSVSHRSPSRRKHGDGPHNQNLPGLRRKNADGFGRVRHLRRDQLIWFVSAAWGRYDVTRLALAQRAHLIGELVGRGQEANCVVVADDENLDIAHEHGFQTVESDNTWLGRKFNDGIQYACENGAEYVVLIGSDDWMHVDLFDRLPLAQPKPPELTEGFYVWRPTAEIITGREITIVDVANGNARVLRSHGRYGVIPWVIHRKALEPSGGRPVANLISKGIDGSLIAGLKVRPNWVFVDPHPYARVDWKTDVNITPYAGLQHLGVDEEFEPWAALEEHYPEHLVDMARDLALVAA